ncbi:hypothetical protein MITS9509_00695 [Synechococcus sp. MIT S9509]|nr:hypothetical protein MITS9504_00319 [Synechococcus sp. MIT S9504]KZR93400.1 hypothetical protein MITS9509_00695 [Synechococcus sp. MIT S9509]
MNRMVKTLQIGTLAVLALVTVVVLGVDQGRQPNSDRPAESKGQLERLRQEHLDDAVPLKK